MRYLFYFIHLHLIVAAPQINLYYTDWVSESESDHNGLQHDCLRVIASIKEAKVNHQIVSYCMSELPSKFNIENNDFFPKFTFAALSKQNITSQQLYLWSAPIDVVERYQFYLNQLLTSNDLSISMEAFYNCTLPRFGSMCQYEFDYHHPVHSSLYEIIDDFYHQYEYKPTNLTCYTHLQCYRGPFPACLDWSEICDGQIDCLDNKLDEEHCWQLEINECKENEYRCANGQCIPISFYKDKIMVSDCIDMSDELPIFLTTYRYCDDSDLSFRCEDMTCATKPFTSSCVEQREELLLQTMFSIKDNSTSDDCWSALKCIIPISFLSVSICNDFCEYDECIEIIERTCPYMFYFPVIPILFGHIYFAFQKNDTNLIIKKNFDYVYLCYNDSRYDNYFVSQSKVLFNNATCYRNFHQLSSSSDVLFTTNRGYRIKLQRLFWSYNLMFNYTSTFCNRSSMYQCVNSLKCISIYRLKNGINDCPRGDDENETNINNTVIIANLMEIYNWLYDESEIKLQYARKNILFQTICDGFTELLPITIEGQNETDETKCEQWECNNTYTRCDNIWNCPNGADEIDCDLSPSLHCPSDHHICVSPLKNQLICLPIKNTNDGKVDCLGAIDEPILCRTNSKPLNINNFYCMNQSGFPSCIAFESLCDGDKDCEDEDDEQFCEKNRTFPQYFSICYEHYLSFGSNVEKVLCTSMNKIKEPVVYFSLDGMRQKSAENLMKNIENTALSSLSSIQISRQPPLRCHRGLDLRVWLNEKNNLTESTCLCPPNFYGDICQYQNQRISLALKFRALSDSWQTLFAIVISLIDDSNERIIHSYEQLTYLSVRYCKIKFNIYLLYLTRPKDSTKHYAIHIDIYEKVSLTYRGSLLFPITFPFLPVHRLAFIVDIPRSNNNAQSCSNHQCIHGTCVKYSNNPQNATFCQCNIGWSGRYCTISHNCMCAPDSLCLGVSPNNRSICVCRPDRFGSRCLIDTVCPTDQNSTCRNGGQCIPTDEYMRFNQAFICNCPKGFSGDQCEIADNKIILSFDKDIALSQSIFIHFIEVIDKGTPVRATTFRTIPIKQDSVMIYWSQPFHLAFIEFPRHKYYLTVYQKIFNRSTILTKMINSSDRCQHISEVFNKSFVELHLLHRIKYYHLPCQKYSLNLSCFYDDIHLCLCYDYDQKRLANCFQFNHNMTFDCLGQSECENGGQCFQDTPDCPQRSICLCPPCFYGRRCQFSTNGFGLSLDGILGYHILPHISITQQPSIVQFSLTLTIIFIVAGIINGILTMITFKSKIVREVGCGLYLFGSSITDLLTIIIFGLKFWILYLAQIESISNRTFLSFQCHSIDFLLRICLNMDQWLNACVAMERAIIAKKGHHFKKKKSKQAAKFVILILLIVIVGTSIHDPLYRDLIVEENDDNDEKRIWCIVTYPPRLQIYNSVVHIFHFFGPFMINLISAVMLITKKSRQQSNLQTHRTYKELLRKQFRQHKHLFAAPVLLVILALPRLIISFVSKCMKSANDSWIYLVGYFISFIPSILTFLVFILPSKFYKKQFRNSVAPYQINIQRRLQL
jgi:hypothetical protein